MALKSRNSVLWALSIFIVLIYYTLPIITNFLNSTIKPLTAQIEWTEIVIFKIIVAFGVIIAFTQITINVLNPDADKSKIDNSNDNEIKNDFRKCINNKIIPKLDSISYQKVLSQYEFQKLCVNDNDDFDDDDDIESDSDYDSEQDDTKQADQQLFFVSSFTAKIAKTKWTLKKDKFKDDGNEYYFTLKLHPNKSMIQKQTRNIILVIDVAVFNDFLDLDTIKNVTQSILQNGLDRDDKFCLMMFNENAIDIYQDLKCVKDINIQELMHKVSKIKSNYSNKRRVGYREIYEKCGEVLENTDGQRRMLLISPWDVSVKDALLRLMYEYSLKKQIFTSFLNVHKIKDDDIKKISNIKGCCYYDIGTKQDLMDLVEHKFECLVNLVAFDLNVKLKQNEEFFIIDKIYPFDVNGERMKNEVIKSERNVFENDDDLLLIKLKKKEMEFDEAKYSTVG